MTFPLSTAASFVDADLFGPHFSGPTWRPWLGFLATFGGEAVILAPDLAELAAGCAGRADLANLASPRETLVIAGRRGGKTRIAAMLATWPHRSSMALAPGTGRGRDGGSDRCGSQQAKVAFRYIKALVAEMPPSAGCW